MSLFTATIDKAYLLYALRPIHTDEVTREVLKAAEPGDDYANTS